LLISASGTVGAYCADNAAGFPASAAVVKRGCLGALDVFALR
jgi:hypothetical protein